MAAQVALKFPAQEKLVRDVIDATSDIPAKKLAQPSTGLLRLLVERLLEGLPIDDPLDKARLRGLTAQRELIDAEGGSLNVNGVAKLLGISRQAVDKRRKGGRLLALDVAKRGYLYPSWQFTGEGVLDGLDEVLLALGDASPWNQALFFLSSQGRLGDRRPLDALRDGELPAVLTAASVFRDHGTA